MRHFTNYKGASPANAARNCATDLAERGPSGGTSGNVPQAGNSPTTDIHHMARQTRKRVIATLLPEMQPFGDSLHGVVGQIPGA